MSRLTDLIAATKAKDPILGAELEREFKALSSRRQFGLNFERHRPEAVELPQRPVRKGDKVRILPPRGSTERGDQRLWRVTRIERADGARLAHLRLIEDDSETTTSAIEDVVVVAEFRDPIYPGLISTGKVERGGDKPFQTVINAENYHALRALTFTHKGKIDAIYIDPPYNTGARDWKYNNDYVEGDDLYRHSKWLAFMERRLMLAKELLNPADSVLIVTIDEKEYLRLGLLLGQVFPEARIQMVSSVIKAGGSSRQGAFGRSDEYLYFLQFGAMQAMPLPLADEWNPVRTKNKLSLRWKNGLRSGEGARRADSPNLFYPVFVRNTEAGPVFAGVGDPHFGNDLGEVQPPEGSVAVWPIRQNGDEGRWMNSPAALKELISQGYAKLGQWKESRTTIYYLARGEREKVESGVFPVVGRSADGSVIVDDGDYLPSFLPTTQWNIISHDAGYGGARLLNQLLPGRQFPSPKSLYAVEDSLRFFLSAKPSAVVLDFFAGSGTTAHAVARLNREDGGSRQAIVITNNEVSAAEQLELRARGLRPGDVEWEAHGICDHITKPRVAAALTGSAASGQPLSGEYRYNAQFPIAEGFRENAEFFTLTYESPVGVGHNRAFARIAPLLWLRAGATGARIEEIPSEGWAVVETYGVLFDLDQAKSFCDAVAEVGAGMAFVVTDDDRRFQAVVRRLPEAVEPVRLYESYLSNFRFVSGE